MAVNGQDIVDYIRQFIGVNYVWGGESPSGFDCSGLMRYGFRNFGVNITGNTYSMIGQGQAIDQKGLRPGDLVYFDTDGGKAGPDHVGIYAGNGMMIHAPKPGAKVREEKLFTGYWMSTFMGGRRMDGVTAVGGNSGDYADEQVEKKLTPEELAASYGWSVAFLNANPELKALFKRATSETWNQAKFTAELRSTKWWQENSENARKMKALEFDDPATYKAMVEANTIKIKQLAAEIGAAIPEGKIKGIVQQALMTGMDEDMLRYTLSQYVKFTKDGTLKGEAGMHEYTLKQYASQMGVELGQEAVKNYAARIVAKVATTQDFEDEIRMQARSAFPGWATQIDSGITMAEIASPYQQMMAKELDIPPASISLNDNLIRRALNGANAEGKPSGVSLFDFQTQLRNDPRWRRSSNGQDDVMKVGAQVLKDMGLLGMNR